MIVGVLIIAWFAVLVYALARTTVFLQGWANKRSIEFHIRERERRHELCRELIAEIRRERWKNGQKDSWL